MNGIILIDKPQNYTSHDIVAIIKRITKEKVGHTGTLDPNATGVLPLLIGKATGISKYLINHDKIYVATLKLGIKTDTADGEGKIVEKKEVPILSKEIIEGILQNMCGKQTQIPPMYSAIKVNGKKLYEYARQGKEIHVSSRNIEIYQMKLIEFNKEKMEVTFEINCSKGTYIRTICETIAENLNTVGYMKELRRTKVGDFKIQNAISIEDIKKDSALLEKNILSIEQFFEKNKIIELTKKENASFLNGVQLKKEEENGLYRIYSQNCFVGLGIITNRYLKRDVIV